MNAEIAVARMSPMRGPLPSYRPAIPAPFLAQAEQIVHQSGVRHGVSLPLED
jgi:hypothetical protein